MNKCILTGVALLISGCAVKPEVTYKIIEKTDSTPDTTLTDSFYLASSNIIIQPTNEKATFADGSKSTATKYTLSVTPGDYTSFKIGITSHDSIWGNTRLSITKIDNSDRVKDVGIETTNNTSQVIKDVGSFLVAAAPLAIGLLKNEIPIDGQKEPDRKIFTNQISIGKLVENKAPSTIYLNDFTTATIELPTQPLGSIPVAELKKPEILSSLKNSFIYSACTDAIITIKSESNKSTPVYQMFTTRINDPRFIQYVAFPLKGKITTHSQCGESVATDATSSPSDIAIATAILTEINSIKTEIEKDKKKP